MVKKGQRLSAEREYPFQEEFIPMSALRSVALTLMVALFLPPSGVALAQVVRTADVTVRGFRESDFPRLIELAENVYAYEDMNGDTTGNLAFTTNSLIVITDEGVLVADGQNSVEKTQRMVDEIARLTPQPIRYVVVCADHGDHIVGNSAFPAEATVIAHPTSAARLEAAGRGIRPATETVEERSVLTLGGVEIRILFLGRAHTGGDLMIHLPAQDILFLSEAYFNRLYPSVGGGRTAFPIEWVQSLRRAEAIDAAINVPGHGFVDSPEVLKEELVNFRRALENLVAESRRLHAAGVPVETAARAMNLGEFQYWYRAVNNLPDAVRQTYLEIEGRLE
jgi:cyclase